ncbi:MAG: aspartyl/asparaginyl beta-hydroxylase domain-containing protein [Azospirillaceae bacterium]|nr:aspartyl/asparaginyl beta-hydroxylase domain-containing protein [Azospirillaceae bacterium]
MHSWQERTAGCGLMLHGPMDGAVDPAPLLAEFAMLDRSLGVEGRAHYEHDGSWSAITLLERIDGRPSAATPALALMPSVARLLDGWGGEVQQVALLRQAPGGTLPWHFDNQALHLPLCRLLLPLVVPADAVTWVGHEAAAYPPGRFWAGDFSMPHQVENPGAAQRVVLAVDAAPTAALVRRFPPALVADLPQRLALAEECRNLMQRWRARQPVASGYAALGA